MYRNWEMGNIHIITGEDDFLVNGCAKKFIAPDAALETIDSRTSANEDAQLRDIAAARESFLSPPFLDPKKATWWRNVNFLPGAKRKGVGKGGEGEERGTSEGVKDALLKLAQLFASSPLPDNQQFIITASAILPTSVFAKKLQEGGAEFISYETPKDARVAQDMALKRVRDMAAETGVMFDFDAEDKFAAKVGLDSRTIYNELCKLRDFIGKEDRPVSVEDVENVCCTGPGIEPKPWQVTDPITARNAEAALSAAAQFAGQSGYAIMMTSVLERHFRELIELKDAIERKLPGAGYGSRVSQRTLANLSRWTLPELRTARVRFMKLREKCVNTGGDPENLVAIEIIRACKR